MIVAKIRVNGVHAVAEYRKPIPAGIIGAQVLFDYADDIWQGLHKTVVFQGDVAKDVIIDDGIVTIPAEVVAKPNVVLRLGVYGVDEEGNLAIPTLWADLGNVRDAADPSGDPSADPTLPVWAQIGEKVGNLDDLNTQAKENLVAAINEALTQGGGEVDPEAVQQIVEDYLAANPPTVTESDPTVPAWAKQPTKPAYTAAEVGALPDTYTPPNQTAQQVGADPAGTAASAVSQHNTDTTAHNDLRLALQELANRINAALDSDDTTLDQLSEVVSYIKSNRSLIDSITTSKVSVTDIVNDLATNVSNKPLSASQGVALKALIDAITIPTALPNPNALTFTGAVTGSYDGSAPLEVAIPSGGGSSDSVVFANDILAEGTVSSGLEAWSNVDTGVTPQELRSYKSFAIYYLGMTGRTYATLCGQSLGQLTNILLFEWEDSAKTILRLIAADNGKKNLFHKDYREDLTNPNYQSPLCPSRTDFRNATDGNLKFVTSQGTTTEATYQIVGWMK